MNEVRHRPCAQGLCQDTPLCHITSSFPSAAHMAYVNRHSVIGVFHPCTNERCDMTKGYMVIMTLFMNPVLQ